MLNTNKLQNWKVSKIMRKRFELSESQEAKIKLWEKQS